MVILRCVLDIGYLITHVSVRDGRCRGKIFSLFCFLSFIIWTMGLSDLDLDLVLSYDTNIHAHIGQLSLASSTSLELRVYR